MQIRVVSKSYLSRHGGNAGEKEEEDRQKRGEAGVIIADPLISALSEDERDDGANYGARRSRDGEGREWGHSVKFYTTTRSGPCIG